jgi:hypothetical protein
MLKRIIHPTPDQVRLTGLAAMVGGALGLLTAPLYSLAYFATDEGDAGAGAFWAEPTRDLLDPLLTFASADVVRLTYGKLFLFVWLGMLAGLVGVHARQTGLGGRLERWGFRLNLLGLMLLVIGAFTAFWLSLIVDTSYLESVFFAFIVPGLLLLVVGSIPFGLGTWRAGVASRAVAVLLIAGGPALFVLSEIATLGGGLAVLYLAWMMLGHGLWSERLAPGSRPAAQTS